MDISYVFSDEYITNKEGKIIERKKKDYIGEVKVNGLKNLWRYEILQIPSFLLAKTYIFSYFKRKDYFHNIFFDIYIYLADYSLHYFFLSSFFLSFSFLSIQFSSTWCWVVWQIIWLSKFKPDCIWVRRRIGWTIRWYEGSTKCESRSAFSILFGWSIVNKSSSSF